MFDKIVFSWQAEESLSIIALSDDESILSIDTFHSSGEAGRLSADFSGIISAATTPARLICIYPALDQSSAGKHFRNYGDKEYLSASIGSKSLNINTLRFYQQDANSPNCIQEAMLLTGEAVLSEGQISVSLNQLFNFVRLSLDLSGTALRDISSIDIGDSSKPFLSETSTTTLSLSDFSCVNSDFPVYRYGVSFSSISVPASRKVNCYLPMRYADANSLTKHAGDKWDFIIRGRDASDKVRSYAAQKTFPRDFTFSAAHCTPISISAASISEAGAVLSSIEQGEASSSRINSIVRFPTNSSVVRIEYFLFESFYKDYWWNWGPQIHEKTGSYTLTEADKAAGFCKISIPAVSPGEYIVAVDSFDEFGIQGNSVSEHHTVSAVAPVEEGIIKRRFGMHHLNISQGRFAGFSHTNLNAYDLAGEDTGIDYFRAYATYEVIGIHRWDGTSSTFANTIHFYDAENDITLALTHMDSISADYYIGRKFYSGDVMYMEGQAGRATGNHIHLEVAEGRQASKTYFAVNGTYNYQLVNKLDIEEYFYLTSGETVVNAAGYSFERR